MKTITFQLTRARVMIIALVLALVGGTALAVGPFGRTSTLPDNLKGGLFVGTTAADLVDMNKVADSRKAFQPWDFPALGGGGVNCAETATVARAGVKFGDNCLAAHNFGEDGGLTLLNFTIDCRSVLNGVIGRGCAWAADGGTPGTLDPPDAGYYFRTLR